MLYSGCEGLGCARWLVLGLLLIGCMVGIGSAVAITGPVVIEKPGTYELTKDIIGTKAVVCIEIQCDNVVLDGKGHRIKGVDAANSAGVLIHGTGPVTNVHIRNLVTEDWFYGIYVWGGKDIEVTGCTATGNFFGIALNPSSDSAITNSRFTGNSYGVVMTGSTRNTVSGCRVIGNNPVGVSLYGSAGNTFFNNLFNNRKNVDFVKSSRPANSWNVAKRLGRNIVGGPTIGGNCWLTPDGTGISETGPQSDGFITEPYVIASGNVDHIPLAARSGTGTPAPRATVTPADDTTTPAPTATPTETPTPGSRPFKSHTLPATIQFEDYDLGGPGVGYFTPFPVPNTLYRSGTIMIERNEGEDGFHLTGTRYREWLRYTVEVPRDRTYTVRVRASSPSPGQYFKVIDECHPKNSVAIWVPTTNSYDTFTMTRTHRLRLTAGTHTLKVFSFGTQDMDWIRFS